VKIGLKCPGNFENKYIARTSICLFKICSDYYMVNRRSIFFCSYKIGLNSNFVAMKHKSFIRYFRMTDLS